MAIVLAFLVVSPAAALGFFKLKDYFISSEIVVPNLVGLSQDLAREEVEKLGLKLSVVKKYMMMNLMQEL